MDYTLYIKEYESSQLGCTCIDFAGDNPNCPEHGSWYQQFEQEAEIEFYRQLAALRREAYGENIPFNGE